VVMSACQTGLGKVFEGGVFGLARAWHYAGAWQIVMSLWNVDDSATASLMTHFMGYDAESRSYRQSLRTKPQDRDPYTALHMHERNRLLSESNNYSTYEPVHGAEFDLRAATIASRKDNPDPALWAAFVMYGLPTMEAP
jgi:CHAT domain-containing protein